jgi:hypothetical protein
MSGAAIGFGLVAVASPSAASFVQIDAALLFRVGINKQSRYAMNGVAP